MSCLLLFLLSISAINEQCANNCKYNDCPQNCNDIMWTCLGSQCVPKDLLPMNYIDITSTILVFFVTIFASIAGIGGGGILIPIYMLVNRLGTDYSIPLAIVTIAGNSLSRFLMLFTKRNPTSIKRFIIDYSVILLIVPFDGNVSFIGALLNLVMPKLVVLLSILILLSIISYKTIKKGIKLYRERNDEEVKIVYIDGISLQITIDDIEENTDTYTGDTYKDLFKNLTILISVFGLLVFFTFIRTIYDECSYMFWVIYSIQFVVFLIIGLLICQYIIHDYGVKQENNYLFSLNDIRWTKKTTIIVALSGSFVGIASSYLGIGGGMIQVPFMLYMGISHEVASSTNAITTFFSSVSSSLQYITTGRVLAYTSIYYFCISMVASFIGLKLSSKMKNKTLIVFILGTMITISAIMLFITGMIDFDDKSLQFNYLC